MFIKLNKMFQEHMVKLVTFNSFESDRKVVDIRELPQNPKK